jgi:hypothetical protein
MNPKASSSRFTVHRLAEAPVHTSGLMHAENKAYVMRLIRIGRVS